MLAGSVPRAHVLRKGISIPVETTRAHVHPFSVRPQSCDSGSTRHRRFCGVEHAHGLALYPLKGAAAWRAAVLIQWGRPSAECAERARPARATLAAPYTAPHLGTSIELVILYTGAFVCHWRSGCPRETAQ